MTAIKDDRQSRFFDWLARFVSSGQLSQLHQAFTDLEDILSSHSCPHHLSQPLAQTTDADEVNQLYDDLSANGQFMHSYRPGLRLSLLRHYARYCREVFSAQQAEPHQQAESTGDALIERLKDDGIPYEDGGAQNGALWAGATPKTDDLISDAKAQGVDSVFSAAKQPWRTQDASPEFVGAPAPSADGEKPAEGLITEDGFRQWLQENKQSKRADLILNTIHRTEQFAQRNHMRNTRLFGVTPAAMQAAISHMLVSRAFLKSDARLYQEFRQASAFLREYRMALNRQSEKESEQPAVSADVARDDVRKEAEAKSAPALEPSLMALLQEDQFSILREALIAKGIHSLDALKQLNLWVFMNQNGLYSIGERQAVYSKIRRSMAVQGAADADVQWKVVTQEKEYAGASPADALVEYCRVLAAKYPLRFRSLIDLLIHGTSAVPLSRRPVHAEDPHLDNPLAYIDGQIDANTVLVYAKWLCSMCKDGDQPQSVISNAANAAGDSHIAEPVPEEPAVEAVPEAPAEAPAAQTAPVSPSPLQLQVEKLVLNADLTGMTLDELYTQIPSVTMVALKQIRDHSEKLVEISERLIHVDAFVDWEEGADKLEEILEKLLAKNNGYVSAAQLYEYVRAEMQMFLNDNDMDDQRKVFDMAEHLFEKQGYHGKRYTFWMNAHISRSKETVTSNLDVIKKFARERNGFFRYDDLVEYLEQVGIKTGNLRGQMQLGVKPVFFYYSSDEVITAESMNIDDAWLEQTGKALQRLFEDVGDHVVLRAINPIWYEQLPTLPGYLSWTPLLLQYILQFYRERLCAKTIGSELNQKYDVLHAMLVTMDSDVQSFADAVVAYLVDSGIPQRQFEAEELRMKLVEGGLIAGSELIWHMPKAIGSDPRFAWNASGEKVSIKV